MSLPQDVQAGSAREDEHRLDQLAQALCGCWVVSLSGGGVSRLLGAILAGDDRRDRRERRAAGGAGI